MRGLYIIEQIAPQISRFKEETKETLFHELDSRYTVLCAISSVHPDYQYLIDDGSLESLTDNEIYALKLWRKLRESRTY